MKFREGQQIGNYTLIKKIGEGGFGEVWLAENHSNPSSEKVAIKLPLKEQLDLQTVKEEIFNWTLAGKHKNILPFIECETFGNQIAIVSEFAPDGSLQDLIRKHRVFSVADAVEIIVGILVGLTHLHNRKIIHRDLKPDNVLFQGKTPRLTDFGISRALPVGSKSATVSGTLHFMSPEAFDGKRNEKTDIWSVGVILYQLLSGNLPFPQREQTELLGAIVMREPDALSDSIPFDLQIIVKKSLEKEPDKRYQTAKEMLDSLNLFLTELNHLPEHSKLNFCTECGNKVKPYSPSKVSLRDFMEYGLDWSEKTKDEPHYWCPVCQSHHLAMNQMDTGGDCESCNSFYPLYVNFCGNCGAENKFKLSKKDKFKEKNQDNGDNITTPFSENADEVVGLKIESQKITEILPDYLKPTQPSPLESSYELPPTEPSPKVFQFEAIENEAVSKNNKKNQNGSQPGLLGGTIPITNPKTLSFIGYINGWTLTIAFFLIGLISVGISELTQKRNTLQNTNTIPTPSVTPSAINEIAEKMLIPFRKGDKFGFSNSNKQILIETKYEEVGLFSEGLAPIKINGKWGVIDKMGKTIAEAKYEWISSFKDGIAIVKICKGDCSESIFNKKYGFIDKTGKVIIDIKYDEVGHISEGVLLAATKYDNITYFDKTGKPLLNVDKKYAKGCSFSEELAAVTMVVDGIRDDPIDEKVGFIDKTGKTIIAPKYLFSTHYLNHGGGEIDKCVSSFSEGLAIVETNGKRGDYLQRSIDSKKGFIDKDGKLVIDFEYGDAQPFSEGLAVVAQGSFSENTLKYGFIDKSGKPIISFNYSSAMSFSEGLAAVKQNNKWGFIDNTGKLVVEPIYENVKSFSDGLAAVELNKQWGFVDKTGKKIIDNKYYSVNSFSSRLSKVWLNGRDFHYIDNYGNEYFEP